MLHVQHKHHLQGGREARVGAVAGAAVRVEHEEEVLGEAEALVGRRRAAAGRLVVRERRERRDLRGEIVACVRCV